MAEPGVLSDALDVAFTFGSAPRRVAPELRPAWRGAILLMLVSRCHGGKAGLEQLHLLNWAVRTPASRRELVEVAARRRLTPLVVRFDPALPAAVDLMVGSRLAFWEGRRLAVTDAGATVRAAVKAAGALDEERAWLASLPVITRGFAATVLEGRIP